MHERHVAAAAIVIALIDLQEGIINVGATNDPPRLRRAVAALADLATAFDLPVLVSCVPTTGGTVAPPLAQIRERIPQARPLVRTTSDVFDDAVFRSAVAATGRSTLVIAGVATEVAVRLAAHSARRSGLTAVIAVDACSGFDARTESATFIALAAAGVELSAVATIAAELAGDFGSESGRLAMRALQSTIDVHAHPHPDDGGAAHEY